MRVAFIIPIMAYKGPIRLVQALVNALVKGSYPVDVTIFYLDPINESIKINTTCEQYSSATDLSRYDIVHTHGLRPDFIGYRRRDEIKRHVVTVHNYVFDDLKFTYNRAVSIVFGRLWMHFWSKADLLVCLNRHMAEYYRGMVSANVDFVCSGIPKDEPNEEPAIQPIDIKLIQDFKTKGRVTMGTVCVVTKRKGIDRIINILSECPGYLLIVIGDGKELKRLIKSAETLGVRDRCLFLGYRKAAWRYFKFFDIFVMPSRSEGFGLTLLEAARNSIPALCSNIGTFKELFSDEEVQFFDLGSNQSIVEGLLNLVKKRSRFAERFHSGFINHYTDEVMASNYFRIYRTALHESS